MGPEKSSRCHGQDAHKLALLLLTPVHGAEPARSSTLILPRSCLAPLTAPSWPRPAGLRRLHLKKTRRGRTKPFWLGSSWLMCSSCTDLKPTSCAPPPGQTTDTFLIPLSRARSRVVCVRALPLPPSRSLIPSPCLSLSHSLRCQQTSQAQGGGKGRGWESSAPR